MRLEIVRADYTGDNNGFRETTDTIKLNDEGTIFYTMEGAVLISIDDFNTTG
jgi:hypothetical protein